MKEAEDEDAPSVGAQCWSLLPTSGEKEELPGRNDERRCTGSRGEGEKTAWKTAEARINPLDHPNSFFSSYGYSLFVLYFKFKVKIIS